MLFGSAQRKPQGLFGGFAPGMQQMPQADPMGGIGMGMQQAARPNTLAPAMGQMGEAMGEPKKPGINWLGVLADALAGAAGREGPYAAQMQAKRQQEYAAQQAQQQREASMEDRRSNFLYEQEYKRANPEPKDPYRFEDNAGNIWQMGPDGQPQRIFTDQAPKQFSVNGGMVTVPNPYAQGAPQQDDDWGPVVPTRPGGANGNVGGGFPVTDGKLDRITIQAESAGNPNAVSPKGARGLWQVMPATARDPGFGIKASNGTQADDARVGYEYRRKMESRYGGNVAKMWAAYNWGPGNVDKAIAKYGENWLRYAPVETRNYVNRNMRALRGSR